MPLHHDTSLNPSARPVDLDEEWEMFQKQVVAPLDHQEIYTRASMVVEPELISHAIDGLPIPGEQAVLSVPAANDEEIRRVREHEERELIMDRLMDEEKAQEDADVKVTLLKRRVDAFKQERRLARAKRNGIVTSTKSNISL
jgi:zinc finger protein 830